MTAVEHTDSLAEHIAHCGWIKFREMNDFLKSRGISTDVGGQELTGEHVKQAHIWPGTVLLGPTSQEYVQIVEELFGSYPITLMIGDMADFNGDEPWWVTWVGPPPDGGVAGRPYPPVNPYVREIADGAKYAYARGTQVIAEMQYRLAELAGIGQLDADESMSLQTSLVRIWEELYDGTLCNVRDESTPDWTWDETDNTYSDGRKVITQVRIEPWEDSTGSWEFNRFMLGDGAPNEFPLGTVSHIAPSRPDDQPLRENRTADDDRSLQERLNRYRDS